MSKSFKKWIFVSVLSLLLVFLFHRLFSRRIAFVTYTKDYLEIQDFAYNIIMVKTFWFGEKGNIYDLSFQQQALSAHVGSRVETVMPLGNTPVAMIVWFPFAYAARFNMALAYTLWSAFSIGILFIALWRVGRDVIEEKELKLLPVTLFLLTLFSHITFSAVILGQTSVLATGLLVYLFFIVYQAVYRSKSNINFLIPIIIVMIGIKPTYFALGIGLLIIFRMWREAFYSSILVMVILVSLTPMLTIKWLPQYLNQLGVFSQTTIPDAYAWAFAPQTMTIFRSAFRDMIGDRLASLTSTIVACSAFIGVLGFSLLAKIHGKPPHRLFSLGVTEGQLFVFLVSSYLLFSPYVGGYEDLLLVCIFVTVLLVGNPPSLTNYKSLILIFLLLFLLFHKFFQYEKVLWLVWVSKAVLLAYMIRFCRLMPEERKGV